MSFNIPKSLTIETVAEIKTKFLEYVKDTIVVELDFSDIEETDIAGVQLILSMLLLCERDKKEIVSKNLQSHFLDIMKKYGFEKDKMILKYLTGE